MNRFVFCLIVVTWAGSGRTLCAEDPPATVQSLTLAECLARALANNLDIRIERLNPRLEDWGVIREQGAFDPVLSAGAQYADRTEPLSPERATELGVDRLDAQSWDFNAGVGGRLPTGTAYELTGYDTRSEGTLSSDPTHIGFAGITLTQPLLKNFWLGPNTALIRVARQNRQIARETLQQQLINTVSDTQNAYYDLVYAAEDYKAKVEDLNRARALLSENRKRLEVGVLSRLDVTQAEAGVAAREEAVLVAERAIKDSENALKRLISSDVREFHGVTLVPVDEPPVAAQELDLARSVQTALSSRPDYRRQRHELEKQGILVQYNRNQLWPQLDLEGSYGFNGRGGTFGRLTDDVVGGENPEWSVGLVVSIPLGNRQARAEFEQSRLRQEQAALALARLEQDIIVAVDNAVGRIATNLKRLDATRAATRLAEESLKAEEEKLRAGTSTSFLVLEAQANLAAARSAEIRARSDYHRSLVELARVEGTTLEKNNIALTD